MGPSRYWWLGKTGAWGVISKHIACSPRSSSIVLMLTGYAYRNVGSPLDRLSLSA